jgi:CBS domain-containing protein
MIISKFMTPVEQVVSCYPSDTIAKALETTLNSLDVGAVVVLHPSGNKAIPVGIVTKTDLLRAYQQKLDLEKHKVEEIMSRTIETISHKASRDKAAEHFENTKHHHALVVNADNQWVGLLTVWDIALEAAKDKRAWPWNRESVSMFHKQYESRSPATKKKIADIPKAPQFEEHSFLGIAGANE